MVHQVDQAGQAGRVIQAHRLILVTVKIVARMMGPAMETPIRQATEPAALADQVMTIRVALATVILTRTESATLIATRSQTLIVPGERPAKARAIAMKNRRATGSRLPAPR